MKINFETIKQLVDTTTKEKGIYGRCELNTIDEKEAKEWELNKVSFWFNLI